MINRSKASLSGKGYFPRSVPESFEILNFKLMTWMVRYQQSMLKDVGVNLYRISCECRPENTFTIIRPLEGQGETLISEDESGIGN